MLSRLSVCVLVALGLTGCATTQVALPSATDRFAPQLAAANAAPIDGPRRIAGQAREEVVHRVDRRLRPAVQRVCQRYFGAGHPCGAQFSSRGPTVAVGDDDINAHIDQDNNIHVLGGLVACRRAGAEGRGAVNEAADVRHGGAGPAGPWAPRSRGRPGAAV